MKPMEQQSAVATYETLLQQNAYIRGKWVGAVRVMHIFPLAFADIKSATLVSVPLSICSFKGEVLRLAEFSCTV